MHSLNVARQWSHLSNVTIGFLIGQISLLKSGDQAQPQTLSKTTMDLCPCFICICGCTGHTTRVKKPPPEIKAIMDTSPTFNCVHCRTIRQPACYRHVQWFTFFCIPIFPYNRGTPYIGCSLCRHQMQPGTSANVCPNCHGWIEDRQRFCANCGELNRYISI